MSRDARGGEPGESGKCGQSGKCRETVESGESGQALLVALVTLLIAGVAAGLVGSDLAIRHRALRQEATRAHLRAMIDGEMATALALLDARQPQEDSFREWAGGEVQAERVRTGLGRYHVRVRARYFASWAAAEAEVVVPAGRPPQVLSYRRLPAAAAVPLQRPLTSR